MSTQSGKAFVKFSSIDVLEFSDQDLLSRLLKLIRNVLPQEDASLVRASSRPQLFSVSFCAVVATDCSAASNIGRVSGAGHTSYDFFSDLPQCRRRGSVAVPLLRSCPICTRVDSLPSYVCVMLGQTLHLRHDDGGGRVVYGFFRCDRFFLTNSRTVNSNRRRPICPPPCRCRDSSLAAARVVEAAMNQRASFPDVPYLVTRAQARPASDVWDRKPCPGWKFDGSAK